MENFTNETIDTKTLPRFEEVQLSFLHPKYKKVVQINALIVIGVIIGVLMAICIAKREELSISDVMYIATVAVVLSSLIFFLSLLSFKKKGFAFREHDVIYRSGLIATNTMVIPYNRVQHVALHEGVISRYFGLAKVEIFTAGGNASDIEIPGIAKEEAENIKQLLMVKIQKNL
jgi:uncharacterized protein